MQNYIHKQLEDANQLLQDTALLRKLVLHKESLQEFKRVEQKKYGLFLFAETISDNQDLLFWNNQNMIPPQADFSLPDGTYSRQLQNGYYVIHKTKIVLQGMSNNIIGYVLIPVLHQYFLETETSQTRFAHSDDALQKISISHPLTEFPIKSLEGNVLFSVTRSVYNKEQFAEPVTIALRLLALALLLVYLHLFIETVNKKRGAITAVSLLAAALMGGAIWLAMPWAAPYLSPGATLPVQVAALAILVVAGAIFYFGLAFATRAADTGAVKRSLRRNRNAPPPQPSAD